MITRITAFIALSLMLTACAGIGSGDDSFKDRKSGVSSSSVAGR